MPRRTLRDEDDETSHRPAKRRSSFHILTNPSPSNHADNQTISSINAAVDTAASASKNSSPSDINASQDTASMNSSPSQETLRESHQQSEDKKRPALTESTNRRRRKRLAVNKESSEAPSASLADATETSRRRSPRLVAKSADGNTTVTPSPAIKSTKVNRESVDCNRSLSSSSSISSTSTTTSRARSYSIEERAHIPKGVVDLYPTAKQLEENKSCSCRLNHCSVSAITEAYLACYGWEHSKMLKEREHELLSPSDGSDEDSQSSKRTNTALKARAPFRHSRTYSDSSGSSLSSTSVDANDSNEMNYMARQPHLTPQMRSILMDWLIELAEEYNLQPKTLHLAVVLVDQCLAKARQYPFSQGSNVSVGSCSTDDRGFIVEREMLQCLGCSCMWIACKIEELEPPSVDDFVYISDSSYTRQQITDMELTVCTALKFRLWHVTPFCYVHEYLRASQACARHSCLAAHSNPVLESMVMYLLELSLLPYTLVMHKPSLIAAAAVYLARATLGITDGRGFWTKTLQHYTGYNVLDLEETVLSIHKYQRGAEESALKSVYAKYKTEKYMRVSLKTVRHAADLGF